MSSPVSSVRGLAAPGEKCTKQAARVASVTVQHARTFKLRFEASCEPGRSYVSVVRPLNLPFTITDKFYSGARSSPAEEECTARAMQLVTERYERGPRHRYSDPVTSSHEYGWWESRECRDSRLDWRIRDSPWLKERLRVLATDDKLNHK